MEKNSTPVINYCDFVLGNMVAASTSSIGISAFWDIDGSDITFKTIASPSVVSSDTWLG